MKIGLITIWHERNYGAEMQAYATIRALQELGHHVEMIDLRLSSINMIKLSLKGHIASLLSNISPAERNFQKFWEKYIPCTRQYQSLEDLQNDPPKVDCYIVGSDQVWNPDIVKSLLKAYLLDFGLNDIKRISYASSIGKNEWDFSEDLTEYVKKQLHSFTAISCREQTGCDILTNTFGVNSTNVVDPTLLHDDYCELIGDTSERRTLAFYPLYFDLELENYSQKLAKFLNLKWVNANDKKHILRGKLLWQRNSIEKWIESIATSQLVITRSFHGLAFSLIYHRQFIIINNSNRSSRLKDLLEQLGLRHRLFTSIEEVEKARPWEDKIDYVEVDQRLIELRQRSWDFLKDNIQ